MERFYDMVFTMTELWYAMYDTGQELYVFFTTPVNEQVTEGDDFLGILRSIDETPFELMLAAGLISVLLVSLLRFFKIV